MRNLDRTRRRPRRSRSFLEMIRGRERGTKDEEDFVAVTSFNSLTRFQLREILHLFQCLVFRLTQGEPHKRE